MGGWRAFFWSRDPRASGGTQKVWSVLVGVFRVGARVTLRLRPGTVLLEGVGDVLDEAQDDVLVFRRAHGTARPVRSPPELLLETEGGTG